MTRVYKGLMGRMCHSRPPGEIQHSGGSALVMNLSGFGDMMQ